MRTTTIYKNGGVYEAYCGLSPIYAISTTLSMLKYGYCDGQTKRECIKGISLDGDILSFEFGGDKYTAKVYKDECEKFAEQERMLTQRIINANKNY